MTFFEFIKSKVFLWQVVIAIGVIILLVLGITWSLSIYTQHGRTILVPTLEGQTVNQIAETMDNVGLDYVVIDSVHNNEAIPGAIVDQIPAAGKKVKKGRKVFLTINAYTREMTVMPQLVDYSLRNAEVVLETSGLKLESVKYVPSEYNELVLEQHCGEEQIKAGTRIAKGTGITLIVGKGSGGAMSVVPYLIGSTYLEAVSKIRKEQFSVGSLIFDETVKTSEDTLQATVYRQTPTGGNGTMELTGAAISLWLTTNTELTIDAMVNDEGDEEPNIFGE